MDLLSMLTGAMTSQSSLNALSQKTGASSDQLSSLLGSALPMLTGALQNNASTQDGAASLLNALTQHTSTASVADQIANADEVDGGKILGHILGGNLNSSISSLANQSGLNISQVTSALGSVAPALLSTISSALSSGSGKKPGFDLSDGLDMNDLMGLLAMGSGATSAAKKGGILGILAKIFGFLTGKK